MIPKSLPGAGNLLLFDNGGAAGYGDPSPISPKGDTIYQRATSRVLEIDPVTLSLVWSYAAPDFYSFNISGAQRLANGNAGDSECLMCSTFASPHVQRASSLHSLCKSSSARSREPSSAAFHES